jgi:AbrB family looped-hinge helix DNA binding protein
MERFGTIGSNAQVSIPKKVRESLGAETNDRLAE